MKRRSFARSSLTVLFQVLLAGTAMAKADEKSAAPAAGAAEFKTIASRPMAKVAIPSAPISTNQSILGMIRLREPNKTLDRVAEWIASMSPGMSGDMLRSQLLLMGVDLKQMTAGGNAAANRAEKPARILAPKNMLPSTPVFTPYLVWNQ